MTAAFVDRVRSRLAATDLDRDLSQVAREESQLLTDAVVLSELSAELSAELRGAGPLEPLLALAGVTDVLVNAPEQVWIDRGSGLERASVRFADDAAIRRLAVRLAGQAHHRLDDAAPWVDAVLNDGTRLHAVLPPLVRHPTISLRVFGRRELSLSDLVDRATMSFEVAELLTRCVAARMTSIVSGATGAGKTTLLAAMLGTVGPCERILTIEEAPELQIRHPHVVALLSRPPNAEGRGAVELRDLVRQALRMRADRLVVGEFRGAEIVDLLAALNTGHCGGAATVHANSASDVPVRLVALAALAGMHSAVLTDQAASALDVIVHIARDRDGIRRVEQIALWSAPDRRTGPVPVWTRDRGLWPGASVLADQLAARGHSAALLGAPP